MDRRRAELQIRAVVVTYRIEVRRRDAPTMGEFRERARAILSGVEGAVQGYPDLAERLRGARLEIEADPGQPSAADGSAAAPEERPRSPGG
jgi:hypothetical protein